MAAEALMARTVALVALVSVLITSGSFVARLPAQQQASTQTELLAEVRLLRQAIESLTGVNARVQIVFGRLQLQEQRTSTAAKRLEEVRLSSTRAAAAVAETSDHLKELEQTINDARRKPEEIEQLKAESAMMTRQLERMDQDRLRLVADETDAANALNQEQGRWSDLNRQLDELERALIKR
jgi:chromosome segregation ATPase